MSRWQITVQQTLALTLAFAGIVERGVSQDTQTAPRWQLPPASAAARSWWQNPLDCTFHPYSERASRADVVLLASRPLTGEGVSSASEYTVDHVLKSAWNVDCRAGTRLQLPASDGASERHRRLLVFCKLENGQLRELQSVEVSDVTERLLRVVAHQPLKKQVADLFQIEASDDPQASRFAIAELRRIPHSDYQDLRGLLPVETIRQRCFISQSPIDSMRRHFFLQLLPLIAETEDMKRLETALFDPDGPLDQRSLQFIGPYLSLANPQQLERLYTNLFLAHHRATTDGDPAERQISLVVAYSAYTGLREHSDRESVQRYFHRAAAEVLRGRSELTDLVLADYRRLRDWRFLDEAGTLAADTEADEAHARAGLMYLMSAQQQQGRERLKPRRLRDVEQRLSAVESERGQFYAETRRIWQVFGQESPSGANE